MFKLWQGIIKETKLLYRDIGGLIILFVMPIILVTVVTVIQDGTYSSMSSSQIPVLLVDHDQDSISDRIKKELNNSGQFLVLEEIDGKKIDENTVEKEVLKGNYQLAIVLPKNMTQDLNMKIRQNVDGILDELGMSTSAFDHIELEKKEIKIYFDPATQSNFKNGIRSQIDKMVAQLESETVYTTFQEQLGGEETATFNESFIEFSEIKPQSTSMEIVPNSVQHNVPAWTLFAVFFIIVPLSINIVKEKSQGTYLRLLGSPTSNILLYGSKIIVYLAICLLQFYSILLVAKYVFPHFGLPELQVSFQMIVLMSLLTITAGLAGISMSILLGMLSQTQEQSAPFGATFVIILAALGGVWIPVFAMSETMQIISKISPMNWALNGYYDIMLRNGGLIDIIPEMLLLSLFALLVLSISLWYDKKKRTV